MGTIERLEILGQTLDKDNKDKVINDLLKRISDLEFEIEILTCDNESLSSSNSELAKRILKALALNHDMQDHIEKEFWIGRLELQDQVLQGVISND